MSDIADMKKMRRKVVSASVIGSMMEWYDFFLYAVIAALILNKQYFPTDAPFISNLMAWGSVAVAFVSRPLGGVIFGHFGDRVGRKGMLMLTLVIMGGSTVLMGLLPTYNQIGILAPILLISLRVLQGIGLGGEWGGAVLMTYEYAEKHNRCLISGLTQMGLALGMFLASGTIGLLSMLLSEEAFFAWGWRVPFLASAILVVVGWYIRTSVMETPEFEKARKKEEAKKKNKAPLVELFANHKKRVLAAFLARGIGGVGFNIMATYVIAFLTQIMNVPKESALIAVNVGTVFMSIMIPIAGWLGDRFGLMRVFIIACILEGLCAFPIFYLIMHSGGNIFLLCGGIVIYLGFIHGIVSSLNPSMFSSLFPTKVRYTGISFTFQGGSMIFSGLTPMIALTLVQMNDNQPWLLCTYMLLIGLMSAAASYWIMKDQQREERENGSEDNDGVCADLADVVTV